RSRLCRRLAALPEGFGRNFKRRRPQSWQCAPLKAWARRLRPMQEDLRLFKGLAASRSVRSAPLWCAAVVVCAAFCIATPMQTAQAEAQYKCCPDGTFLNTRGQCQSYCPNGSLDSDSILACRLGIDPTTIDASRPGAQRCLDGTVADADPLI